MNQLVDANERGIGFESRYVPDVSTIFGTGVLTAASRINVDIDGLSALERECVANACISRQREFATGRVLARSLMERIGMVNAQVLVNDDRSPVWPQNVVGSISHAGGVCVVAIAPRGGILGLGVDLEHNQPLDSELVEIICTEREREWLAQHPRSRKGRFARVIFSAKECTFKCQYTLTKTHLDYGDLDIELDAENLKFVARFRRAVGDRFPRHSTLYGNWCTSATWIVTGITLRRGASPRSASAGVEFV